MMFIIKNSCQFFIYNIKQCTIIVYKIGAIKVLLSSGIKVGCCFDCKYFVVQPKTSFSNSYCKNLKEIVVQLHYQSNNLTSCTNNEHL